MREASVLIPARFLTLLGHLCVLISLLWESKASALRCLPSEHQNLIQMYQTRLEAGYAAAIALALLELTTFLLGLTMFSPSVSLISAFAHGLAPLALAHSYLDGWFCDWFWVQFAVCSVLPSVVDICVTGTSSNEHQQLTQSHNYKGGWSVYLVLAAVATTLGSSLPVGYSIGVVNTPAEVIKSFCNESLISRYDVQLSAKWLDVLWSCVVSVFIVGGCSGSVLGATLANSLGRKKATIVTSLLSLVGALFFCFCRAANSVEMLILGRLLVGLSGGLTTSIVPMYLAELAPLRLTGAVGVACPMGVNVGVLVGQLMGLDFLLGGVDDWPYLLSVYALLVTACLPLLCALPESPKYLYIVVGDEHRALNELSRVRGVSASLLTDEMDALREEARGAEGVCSWSMMTVLSSRRLRLPLVITAAGQAGQQFSGINAVFYYSQTIFKQAGLSAASAQYATIACGAVNVLTALLMVRLLPRCGRRPLLLGSVGAAAAVLTALAVSMNLMKVSGMSYVCMAAVLAYVLVYGFGLGPIPYFIGSEIFEVGPRPAGMAWGSLANWGGNFIVGMCFPLMRDSLGPYSFLVFAACTAALFLLCKFYFPETRGKTPTQVAELCSRGFKSRPTRPLGPACGDV